MTLIGKKIEEFNAEAYNPANGEFISVSDQDLQGKWRIVCFYPADFTFVCPTESGGSHNQYAVSIELGGESYAVSTATQFTPTAWHDHSDAISKIEYIMIGEPS